MASRSADPALIISAVESASGELVLSNAAAANRSRKGLPNRRRGGLSAVPAKSAERRLRWFKTRNSRGYTIDVVARREDRTDIEVRRYDRYNFERRGTISNRAMPKIVKRMPEGVSAADVREALG
jgi:hypothetical protein